MARSPKLFLKDQALFCAAFLVSASSVLSQVQTRMPETFSILQKVGINSIPSSPQDEGVFCRTEAEGIQPERKHSVRKTGWLVEQVQRCVKNAEAHIGGMTHDCFQLWCHTGEFHSGDVRICRQLFFPSRA